MDFFVWRSTVIIFMMTILTLYHTESRFALPPSILANLNLAAANNQNQTTTSAVGIGAGGNSGSGNNLGIGGGGLSGLSGLSANNLVTSTSKPAKPKWKQNKQKPSGDRYSWDQTLSSGLSMQLRVFAPQNKSTILVASKASVFSGFLSGRTLYDFSGSYAVMAMRPKTQRRCFFRNTSLTYQDIMDEASSYDTSIHFIAAQTSIHFIAAQTSIHFIAAQTSIHFIAAQTSIHSIAAYTSFPLYRCLH
ncbi:hypothetical protein PoB_001926200 [Plakobranchus ocellatus]|uniref:Uncharacterized protein n=1 Tax=Plakobranchus ocellatus TaxID=259542 RepID=A0AAV3ZE59_9GAST|nr:hypothetical protein PoB_001926200 [Plakobranchus ocellatus]